MEKHNEKKLKNMLSDRAKYHRKFQKGMSPFCSLAGEPISIGGGMCESVSIPDTIDAKKYVTQSIGKKNFIDREGNLIRIKGDHIDTLRDIIGDTTDTFEMSERDYDAYMNAINNHFLKRLGWIQVSKEFVPHIAIHRRPTPSQEATLIRVMDDYSRRPYDLNLYLYDTGNPVWKKYNLTETIPEEVMKRIHRYFNTGILSEDISFEGKAMFCPSCGHRTLFFDNSHHLWSCSDCRKNYKYLLKNNHIEFIPEEYDVKLDESKKSLTGTQQDIGKIVRCKRNAKDRFTGEWRIVGVREKVYRGYTDVYYDLKPVDMPPVNTGVTATCDWLDMELVPEKPAAKEAPKRDGSHLIKKYLTPESFKFIHDVEDVSTPGHWHADGTIVTFMYGADKYRLDVQGGWTNDRQKFWLVELKNLTKDTYYQKVDKSGKDIGYVYGSLDIGKLLTSSNWSEVNPRGKSMKTSHLTDSLNKTKLKEEFVGKPEVGKTYWFKHSGGIRSGEFTRQTTSLNCFYVPEVDREVCIPIWANIATSREDIEGIEGVVDKMEKDTKVPTKMRAYNGKFFPVNEAVSATEPNLVVYNGTNTENFDYSTVDLSNSREIGLHCGTEDACRDRGYKFINKLTLQSPKMLPLSFDMTAIWSSIEFIRRLAQYNLFDEKQLESLENQMRKYADSPNKYIEYSTLLREFFLNKGYNVISYPNEVEDVGSTSYIVLDMSVVKPVNKMEESMNKFPGRAQLIGALKTFDKNGKVSTRGNWRIANGGYDLAFEVYYNNTPVAQGYTDGTLSTDFDTTEFGFSKSELRDIITSVYTDMKTGGNILSEAYEKGVKVYEVEKDGPPDVGRQIIAFVDSHEEYTILTRQDKDYVAKQNWDDKEGHKSEDGEYYSGKNGWIYSLGYTKYIYLDELDLVPQRHHDKVEKEKQAGVAQKQAITDKLISIYGEELGNKLAEKCISVSKDGRRVELVGYDRNLIQVAGYASALKSLYDSMSNEFGPDIAKEIVLKSPSVTTPRYHSVYKIPLKTSKDIPWSYYLGCGYSAEVVNGVLVLTELHNKASYGDLEDRLKRDKILDPNSYKSLRSYAVNESLNLKKKPKEAVLDEGHQIQKYKGYELDWNEDEVDPEEGIANFNVYIRKDGKELKGRNGTLTFNGFRKAREYVDSIAKPCTVIEKLKQLQTLYNRHDKDAAYIKGNNPYVLYFDEPYYNEHLYTIKIDNNFNFSLSFVGATINYGDFEESDWEWIESQTGVQDADDLDTNELFDIVLSQPIGKETPFTLVGRGWSELLSAMDKTIRLDECGVTADEMKCIENEYDCSIPSSMTESKKKKKKPYDSINYNAGNVEHNVAMFNKMNNPIAQPTVNPINGTTGEGCCEALEDRKKKLREGMRLTNGMKEDESLYFDDGDYSYHLFRRTPFSSNAETEWAVLVVDYGLRFHHDKMYKDEKTGIDTVPVDVVHDKPKKIAYFEFTDETLPDAANAFLDEDGKKFTEVIKAEAQKHIEITEDLDTDAEPKDVITEVGKQELRDFLTSIICEREDDLALEFGEDDRLWDEFFEVNLESYTDKYREDIIKHFNLTTKED